MVEGHTQFLYYSRQSDGHTLNREKSEQRTERKEETGGRAILLPSGPLIFDQHCLVRQCRCRQCGSRARSQDCASGSSRRVTVALRLGGTGTRAAAGAAAAAAAPRRQAPGPQDVRVRCPPAPRHGGSALSGAGPGPAAAVGRALAGRKEQHCCMSRYRDPVERTMAAAQIKYNNVTNTKQFQKLYSTKYCLVL